ncbi:hypothetical protein H634G_06695, partial [Metarhizium anisopliae BRIP 53293]
MSPLNSPEGQYLSLAGSFQKSQKTLANNFKTWGLKSSSKNQAPTILAATEAAYTNSVKQVEDARNRQILILNEDWVNECCDKKSWIVPENKHIWENHSATAPNNPPNPLENPPPKPPNPPENPQPQPPNPPENPQPQPPNPPENPQPQPPISPENPPKHESDNESMEVALLKKQIEDLKNSKTNSKDGPSDRYDQSEDQKECFEIFYE